MMSSSVHQEGEYKKNANSESEVKWSIRSMRSEDIVQCLEIWRKVELTEAHSTVENWLNADPGGFYVAELDNDSGKCKKSTADSITRYSMDD